MGCCVAIALMMETAGVSETPGKRLPDMVYCLSNNHLHTPRRDNLKYFSNLCNIHFHYVLLMAKYRKIQIWRGN